MDDKQRLAVRAHLFNDWLNAVPTEMDAFQGSQHVAERQARADAIAKQMRMVEPTEQADEPQA
jgi:hypothetical protein